MSEGEAPVADIILHPNHPVFTQSEGTPACPVCRQAIVPGTPVAYHYISETRYMVVHKGCAAQAQAIT